MTTRRRFTGDFKAKVALEALRGDKTIQEIATKHKVHPNQVSTWKRQAMEGIARWTEPLRIGIKGQASDTHIQTVRRYLSMIKNLTGIDIEKVNPPDKPENLTILFLPPEEMGKVKIKGVDPKYIHQIAAPLSCYFLSFKKPPDSIVRCSSGTNECPWCT